MLMRHLLMITMLQRSLRQHVSISLSGMPPCRQRRAGSLERWNFMQTGSATLFAGP